VVLLGHGHVLLQRSFGPAIAFIRRFNSLQHRLHVCSLNQALPKETRQIDFLILNIIEAGVEQSGIRSTKMQSRDIAHGGDGER
jgi:hypothetical protein